MHQPKAQWIKQARQGDYAQVLSLSSNILSSTDRALVRIWSFDSRTSGRQMTSSSVNPGSKSNIGGGKLRWINDWGLRMSHVCTPCSSRKSCATSRTRRNDDLCQTYLQYHDIAGIFRESLVAAKCYLPGAQRSVQRACVALLGCRHALCKFLDPRCAGGSGLLDTQGCQQRVGAPCHLGVAVQL